MVKPTAQRIVSRGSRIIELDQGDAAIADQPNEIDVKIQQARAFGAPEVYVNGFTQAVGLADIVILFERNGFPVSVTNMSYTTAKTLALGLNELIGQLEAHTQRDMLTTMDVAKMFQDATP